MSLIHVSRKEEGKDGKTNPQKHAARLDMLNCASQGKNKQHDCAIPSTLKIRESVVSCALHLSEELEKKKE